MIDRIKLNSTMVKKIVITFGILLSIVSMFFISLSNGIRLGDYDFDNVNIQGLYLKYDKRLIIGTQSVSIFNDDKTKSASFRLKFSIESFFDKYFVRVEQFLMMDPYLNVSGNIIFDLKNINLDQISKTHINDFSIQFHQNVKAVHADICYVKYIDDSFYFSFKNPTYAGIKLDDSKVIIDKYETLKLELKSTDKVNGDLLSLLSSYKINLPLKQIYGKNSTVVKLDIPFDIKKDIKAYSDIYIKKGKVELYDLPVYVNEMQLTLEDNKLISKGKLLKRLDENGLQYDIDTDFIIDFSQNSVQGNFIINKGKFYQLLTKDTKGKFDFDFKEEFLASIKIDPESLLIIDDEPFKLKRAQSHYTDSNKTFNSQISLQHTDKPLKVDIEDFFNIEKNSSHGTSKLLYNDKQDVVFSDTLIYDTNFDETFNLLFKLGKLQWYHNGTSYVAKNINGEFKKGKISSVLQHIETLDGESFIDDLSFNYFQKKIVLEKEIFQNNILAKIDLTDGKVDGVIIPKNKDDLEKIEFFGNIYKKAFIKVPKWDGEFKVLDSKQFIVNIKKPLFLQKYFDFLNFRDKSSIYIDKKKGFSPHIYAKNIDFDFKKFQDPKNADDKPALKYVLYWENSAITYNGYKFKFNKADIVSKGRSKKIILTDTDGSSMTVNTDVNHLVMQSYNLSGDYVNSIFNKDLVKGGNIEFFLNKGNIDTLEGTVKLKDTTLKELQFVDNLLLFVNSAPALINPLLGLPTLFRFGKNKFTVNGYHVIDGSFDFTYYKSKNILEIKDIKTIGNINNFNGSLQIDLNTDTIRGNVNVVFLKDFASVIQYIPLVNKLLDKDNEIFLPITISGTLKDTNFTIKQFNKEN